MDKYLKMASIAFIITAIAFTIAIWAIVERTKITPVETVDAIQHTCNEIKRLSHTEQQYREAKAFALTQYGIRCP